MPDNMFDSADTRPTLRESSTIIQPSAATLDDGFLYGTDGDDWFSTIPQYPNLDGLGGNDRLTGDARDNILRGGAGADQLFGLAGNDTLDGGTAQDRMDGGTGNDTYFADRDD